MPRRAIVVSDALDVLHSLNPALVNQGFSLLCFRDGIEGTKKVYETLPDLVIMEDRLSATDSVDLCSQIGQLSCIPIILLGLENGYSEIVSALQRGADFYLSRPFSIPELVARVRSLLRRERQPLESARRVLNVDELSARIRDRNIKLTRTEFRLLAYMMLNTGRVIPVGELLPQVWPGERVTGELLRFHISRLRRKLDNGAPRTIFNHRGIGYRLAYDPEAPVSSDVYQQATPMSLSPESSREALATGRSGR